MFTSIPISKKFTMDYSGSVQLEEIKATALGVVMDTIDECIETNLPELSLLRKDRASVSSTDLNGTASYYQLNYCDEAYSSNNYCLKIQCKPASTSFQIAMSILVELPSSTTTSMSTGEVSITSGVNVATFTIGSSTSGQFNLVMDTVMTFSVTENSGLFNIGNTIKRPCAGYLISQNSTKCGVGFVNTSSASSDIYIVADNNRRYLMSPIYEMKTIISDDNIIPITECYISSINNKTHTIYAQYGYFPACKATGMNILPINSYLQINGKQYIHVSYGVLVEL